MRLFTDASSLVVDPWLRRAFTLAENGRGTTSPNPMVGCVLVRDGRVVGEGWHRRAGGPHAEVEAIGCAGETARGATAYVTLEPCNHTGRTGPCTTALREAGVAEVVVGMRDPDPSVGGSGAEALASAGIAVRFAEDPAPFEELNEAWVKRVRTGMPWVQVKVALTLDGRVALRRGSRSAITGPGGAEMTRRLRAAADAVVVGSATAAIDDPALTVREADGALSGRQPVRAVLGRTTVPPASSRVFAEEGPARPALMLLPEDAAVPVEAPSPQVVRYPGSEGAAGALRALAAARGVTRVLVEPGPRLFAALVDADAVDELVVVTAGGLGGEDAVPLWPGAYGISDTSRLDPRLRGVEAGVIDGDAVTVWRRAGEKE